MDITSFLHQVNKISEYAKNLKEIDHISALDQAVLKRNVEKLYEILIEDYMKENKIIPVSDARDLDHKVSKEHISFDFNSGKSTENGKASSHEHTENHSQQKKTSHTPTTETQVNIIETPPEESKAISEMSDSEEVQKLKALFQIKEVSELSDKLSQAKIQDIKKGMGLNERIFTQNELFGGNNQAFEEAITQLNKASSLEEASEYIIAGPGIEYQWLDENRKQIAINFIKLIARKYK